MYPNSSHSVVFTFGLVVESIKEFKGVSVGFEKLGFEAYYNVKNYFCILFGITL
jgi:hypothetical protein